VTREEHIFATLRELPFWTRRQDHEETILSGPLALQSSSGAFYGFVVEITVPADFPAQKAHPQARILESEVPLTEAAHVGPFGNMCVQMEARNQINYASDGLLGFVKQVIIHLERARIQALTSSFPGEEYSHFSRGIREYQEELPAIRKKFEVELDHLPAKLRWMGHLYESPPSKRKRCPCGSGDLFKSCHWNLVMQVRRAMRQLGPEPLPPYRTESTWRLIKKK
jgi:hypothetical protein